MRHPVGDLLVILGEGYLLTYVEFAHKVRALTQVQRRPDRQPDAIHAGIETRNLALPLGVEQRLRGRNIRGLNELRVERDRGCDGVEQLQHGVLFCVAKPGAARLPFRCVGYTRHQ